MRKLRLLVWEKCNRRCIGCCNKDWDLSSLEVCNGYGEYGKGDEILLTGGEPLLDPDGLMKIIQEIRKQSAARIYVYTAKVDNIEKAKAVLEAVDGICVTLHEECDVVPFLAFDKAISGKGKSLRLNVFKEAKWDCSSFASGVNGWMVKGDIEWIKNAPLPTGEELKRL